MSLKLRPRETRTIEQIKDHYEVEKALADRLRNARAEDRAKLYSVLYTELFRKVPLHPQLTRVHNAQQLSEIVSEKMRLLSRFLGRDTVFLELGAGDCRLAIEAAKYVKHVYALDVSDEVNQGIERPENFELVLSNGTDIPIAPGSVNVAYSYQLMEHIHPDDAREQLMNIYRVLAPGGVYICITPNRLSGPHDVSRYFDPVATGFHMKEYTVTELGNTFREAGFGRAIALVEFRKQFVEIPTASARVLESAVEYLPRAARQAVVEKPLIRNVLMAAVVGKKV